MNYYISDMSLLQAGKTDNEIIVKNQVRKYKFY